MRPGLILRRQFVFSCDLKDSRSVPLLRPIPVCCYRAIDLSSQKGRWSVTPTRRYTLMPFEISPVASSTGSSSECLEDGKGYTIEARALRFFIWIINLHSQPSNRTLYCWHPLHFPSPGEGKVLRTCRVRHGCVDHPPVVERCNE